MLSTFPSTNGTLCSWHLDFSLRHGIFPVYRFLKPVGFLSSHLAGITWAEDWQGWRELTKNRIWRQHQVWNAETCNFPPLRASHFSRKVLFDTRALPRELLWVEFASIIDISFRSATTWLACSRSMPPGELQKKKCRTTTTFFTDLCVYVSPRFFRRILRLVRYFLWDICTFSWERYRVSKCFFRASQSRAQSDGSRPAVGPIWWTCQVPKFEMGYNLLTNGIYWGYNPLIQTLSQICQAVWSTFSNTSNCLMTRTVGHFAKLFHKVRCRWRWVTSIWTIWIYW